MRVIAFDIFGDLAHFRRFYTTSSPLSFAFPPPTTIAGMLGAIIGIDKSEYLEVFSPENCKIGLQIINPIRKLRLGMNLINTKGNYWIPTKNKGHEARTQVKMEFIKDARYRIYFHHKDEELFKKLSENIQEHKTFFTLSLGLSELLGNFQFIKESEFEEREKEEVYISSVVSVSQIKNNRIIFEEGKNYFRERIPLYMSPERIVKKYEDVIFENHGKSIRVEVDKYWRGEDGENVLFF